MSQWFSTVVLDGVSKPQNSVPVSLQLQRTYGREGRWRFKGSASAQKALQGSEDETRELLEERKRKVCVSPSKGSL